MNQIQGALKTIQNWIGLIHPDTLIGALVLLAIFACFGKILSFIVRRSIKTILDRDQDQRIDRLAASFMNQFARVFVWVFVAMLYAHLIPALDRLGTALLASVSIASVVIGLAAQSTLANFVAGISLIFYKPFRMGDRIQVMAPTGLETGIVENVSLGYTILQTFDNRRIVLSNSVISNAIMVNLSMVHPKVMAVVPFSIGYGADIDRARAVATALASEHSDVQEIVACPVVALNTFSVDFVLRAWCADGGIAVQVKCELLEAIKKRFNEEGIEIPFPYQNVILHQNTEKAPD